MRPLLLAFLAAMVAKQYALVDQLGDALHRGGARLCLATLGFVLIATPWAATRRGRLQVLLLLGLDLAITAVTYGDLLYYRRFQDLTSIASLRFAGQLGHVRGSVFDLAQPGDILFALDLVALSLLALLPGRWIAPIRWRTAGALAVVGAALITAVALDSPRMKQRWRGNAWLCGDLGLLNYHALDVASFVGKLHSAAAPDEATVEKARSRFAAPATASSLDGIARGRNVIVVQLESFQGFAAGMDVGGQPLTPNLDALAAESLRFPRFYSQTGQGRTSDAEFLANCSLYPLRTGAVFFEAAGNDLRCLPELLRDEGYRAFVLHSAAPDFWNRASFYPAMGYERFHHAGAFEQDETIGLGLSDESFFRQTLAKLEETPEPYYATAVTLSSHDPFDFPGIPRTLDLGRLEGTAVGPYLHAVHYADRALGGFVKALREKGILDRSVLVVFGDHGAMNRANSNVGDLLGLQDDDLFGWADAQARVPLLIRLPGGAHAGERPEVGGEVDLAPTLAALLGVPRGPFLGRNLLAPAELPMAIFYNGSAIARDRLLISADAGLGGARCVSPTGKLPLEACDELQRRSRDDLALSRETLEQNLLRALRGLAPGETAAVLEGSAMGVNP